MALLLYSCSRSADLFLPDQLGKQKDLNLSHLRHFVLDECDKVLEKLGECLLPWLSRPS
jgi:hypothetical protein